MNLGADKATSRRAVKATTLLSLQAVGVILYVAQHAFIPVAMALFLALLLSPAVNRLQRWHVPRGLAVAIVMLVVLLAAADAVKAEDKNSTDHIRIAKHGTVTVDDRYI